MQHYEIKRSKAPASPPTPAITLLLVLLCFLGFGMSVGQNGLWLQLHSFSVAKFDAMAAQHTLDGYLGMATMMFWASICQLTVWQLFINIYFIWVFGSTVEERLGGARYLLILLLCWIGGWLFLDLDSGASVTTFYAGPSILTAGLIGAYLIFFPEKKMAAAMPIPKYSYRIFKEEVTVNPREMYGISPWFVLGGFIFYQFAMQLFLDKVMPDFALLRTLPAIGTFLIGFSVALTLVIGATRTVEGNPLKSLAWMKYRHLRTLDMTHEQAIRGAARLLAVPEEQVKDWIGSGIGGPPTPKQQ